MSLPANIQSFTVAQLEDLSNDLGRQRDDLARDHKALAQLIDAKKAEAKNAALVNGLSPAQRTALAQQLKAASAGGGETMGKLGG